MNAQAQLNYWGFNMPPFVTVNSPTTCNQFGTYMSATYSSGNSNLSQTCSNAFNQLFSNSSNNSQVCNGTINLSSSCPTFTYIPANTPPIAFFNYPNAKVGIGTQTPAENLEVVGSIKASGNVLAAGITFGDGSSMTSFAPNLWQFGKLGPSIINTIYTAGTDRVGVGTNMPWSRFHVQDGDIRISTSGFGLIFPDGSKQTTAAFGGGTGVNASFRINDDSGYMQLFATGNTSGLTIGLNAVVNGWGVYGSKIGDVTIATRQGGANGDMHIANTSVGKVIKIYTQESWGSRANMEIGGGKVKLNGGGNHPDALLDVNGLIYSRKTIVTQFGWGDDEFDAQSPTLAEEAAFANSEKHLLGVPSEAELQAKGLDLGDMQAIQMRKIEQIYKHLWQMEKENKELKSEIVAMKKRLK